jgi:MFS family permease
MDDKKFNYGWVILSALIAFLFMTGTIRYSYGVIFKPMLEEFGWSRTVGSWAYGLNMICFAVTLPFSGYLYDRHNHKHLLLFFGLIMVAGVLIMPHVQVLWQLVICYGVLAGIGFGGTSMTLLSAVVSRWFRSRLGTLMAVGLAGTSLGQMAMLPFVSWITATFGWRRAFSILGLIAVAVLAIVVLLMKNRPTGPESEQPATPDVAPGQSEPQTISDSCSDVIPETLSITQAMKTVSFWMICIVYMICGFGDFLVDLHIVPMLTDRGASLMGGGTIKAFMGGASFLGVLFFGWSTDKFGSRVPLSISFGIRALIVVMVLLSDDYLAMQCFAVLFGFTFLASAPIATVLVRELYGVGNIALITGSVVFLHHAAGGFGSVTGSILFDNSGSYRLALGAVMVLSLLATVMSLMIPKGTGHTLVDADDAVAIQHRKLIDLDS